MRKIFIVVISLLFTPILVFTQQYKYIDTKELNLREGPGANYTVLSTLKKNQKVSVLSERNKWAEVQGEDGIRGYVSKKFLSSSQVVEKNETSGMMLAAVVLLICMYVVARVRGFFSRYFGSSGSIKTASSLKLLNQKKPEKLLPFISDVQVKSSKYLQTFDEKGKQIAGAFLAPNEGLVGYTQSNYITVRSTRYLTIYDCNCKTKKGMFLASNERFEGCAGNTFTTLKSNNLITTYSRECKQVSSRFRVGSQI